MLNVSTKQDLTQQADNENKSLVQLDEARRILSQISTVDEVKEIRDKAEAMRVYAKQAKLGLDAQNHAAEIKIRAERRAGELLKEMETHSGGRPSSVGKTGDTMSPVSMPPTLNELGISKKQSSRWQALADIPEEKFEAAIEVKKSQELASVNFQRLAKETKKQEQRQEMVAAAAPVESERYRVIHGDFRSVLPTLEKADFIITDPPYPRKFVPLYESLAHLAENNLKDGGSLLVMCGQSYFPEIIAAMSQHMRYHWMLAYTTPGGQSAQLWERKVNTFWKPILWFVKGDYQGEWIGDVAKSNVNDNEKSGHDWGQSTSGMVDLMRRFVFPGALVIDPFCGAGATGLAAMELQCRFVGIDIDSDSVAIASKRLSDVG